jgi:hypothetical protein
MPVNADGPALDGAMASPEQPVFGLGMSGFAPDERQALESALPVRESMPGWRVCAFAEADAWWISGARTRVMPDGNLRVAAGLPTEKALRLDLSAIDRPIAFAVPLPADFEPHWQFNPASPSSIEAVLLQFDAWLWQARAQFVLGGCIMEAEDRLAGNVFHVSHGSRLLAVIDFQQGKAAYQPRLHPVALSEARWERRPGSANDLPGKFVQTTPAELVWTYVRHTTRDVLPTRYRHRTIYYRRVPRVPLRLLRDSQLLILYELSERGSTLDDLERRTALPRPRLEHDVASLYYANAITTDQRRAAVPGHGFKGVAPVPSSPPGSDSAPSWDETVAPSTPTAAGATTPVMLGPREDTTLRSPL